MAKHPEQVRTLVAHEPSAMRELPDAEIALAHTATANLMNPGVHDART